jgi:hypothetical protein
MTIPNIHGEHLSILRQFKLIAYGEPQGGKFPKDGLHERNTWLYDALVCHVYAVLLSEPVWRELPDSEQFDTLRDYVRQFISDANPSGYSREIQNWIGELTWTHLRAEGFPYLTAQMAHDGRHPQPELCAVFAHYIIGHAFTHGGAGICASDVRRAQECANIVAVANGTGFAVVSRGNDQVEKGLIMVNGQKFSGR